MSSGGSLPAGASDTGLATRGNLRWTPAATGIYYLRVRGVDAAGTRLVVDTDSIVVG